MFANFNGGCNVNFEEVAVIHRANAVAINAVRTNKGGNRNCSRIGEKFRNRADAANILFAILSGKTESKTFRKLFGVLLGQHFRRRVQIMADIVAVKNETVLAKLMKLMIDDVRDRALAASAQTGKPKNASLIAIQFFFFRS